MSVFEFSCVLILPYDCQYVGNQFSQALGYGNNTFKVPLIDNQSYFITHYGSHSWVTQSFLDILNVAKQGFLPEILLLKGFTVPQCVDLMSQMVISAKKDIEPVEHFSEVLTQHGLMLLGRV